MVPVFRWDMASEVLDLCTELGRMNQSRTSRRGPAPVQVSKVACWLRPPRHETDEYLTCGHGESYGTSSISQNFESQ